MTYTRFFKLLAAPVLAGFLLWPSAGYCAAVKATVGQILRSPSSYKNVSIEVSGIVDKIYVRKTRAQTITVIILAGDPSTSVPGKTLRASVPGDWIRSFAKGDKVSLTGFFHSSYTGSNGSTLKNVFLGDKIWKAAP